MIRMAVRLLRNGERRYESSDRAGFDGALKLAHGFVYISK